MGGLVENFRVFEEFHAQFPFRRFILTFSLNSICVKSSIAYEVRGSAHAANYQRDDTDRWQRRWSGLSACISNFKEYNCAIFTRISRRYRARLAGGFLQRDSHHHQEWKSNTISSSGRSHRYSHTYSLLFVFSWSIFPPFTQHSFSSQLLGTPHRYFTDGGGSKRKNIFNPLLLILFHLILPFSFPARNTRRRTNFRSH